MANDRRVSIDGDAVGNVITTGDSSLVEAHVVAGKHEMQLPDPATVDVAMDLAVIRGILVGMGSEHQKKIGRAIDDATDEAGKRNPDKDELGKALERALSYAKSATTFATETKKLGPHLRSAVAWLGEKWHGLLNFLA
jgi:hypothetical protein